MAKKTSWKQAASLYDTLARKAYYDRSIRGKKGLAKTDYYLDLRDETLKQKKILSSAEKASLKKRALDSRGVKDWKPFRPISFVQFSRNKK